MSQVYARQRTETLTGYVVTASKIRIETLKLILRHYITASRGLKRNGITRKLEGLLRVRYRRRLSECVNTCAHWHASQTVENSAGRESVQCTTLGEERSNTITHGERFKAWTLIINNSKFRKLQQESNKSPLRSKRKKYDTHD